MLVQATDAEHLPWNNREPAVACDARRGSGHGLDVTREAAAIRGALDEVQPLFVPFAAADDNLELLDGPRIPIRLRPLDLQDERFAGIELLGPLDCCRLQDERA